MRSKEAELQFIYVIFDLLILNASVLFVGWLSYDVSLRNFNQIGLYLLEANLAWVITYVFFTQKNLYLGERFINRLVRITKRVFLFLAFLTVISYVVIPEIFPRVFILEYTLLFYIGKLCFYYFLFKFLKFKRSKGYNTKRVLIAGLNDTSRILRKIIDSNSSLGYKFTGFISTQYPDDPDVIGISEDLVSLIEKHDVQMIFIIVSIFANSPRPKEYMKICNQLGVRLRFIPENQHWLRSGFNLESIENIVVLNPQEIPMDDIGARVQKRMFDLVFSTCCIVFLFSWLFPILMIVIKLSSKGPVFFIQKRTGINNITFNCIKFRSMAVNENSETQQSTPDDSRITKIGRLMRKTNVDELPQFFNVWMGDMSVVGPRPHMLKHTEQYSELVSHYLIRHYVNPGITGWAQVSGFRGETKELWKMEKRVEYDLNYIEHWNLWWDVKIILKTVIDRRIYYNAG